MSKDLFDESTMTFGEHLEVLRIHLWKALIGLVIGVVIALLCSRYIILWIQIPAVASMERNFLEPVGIVEFDKTASTSSGATPGVPLATAPPAAAAPSNASKLQAAEIIGAPQRSLALTVDALQIARKLHDMDPAYPAPKKDAEALSVEIILSPNELNKLINIVNAKDLNPRTDGVDEAFMVYMKVSLIAGIVFASPWILYQIWQFVAAGLYPHERSYVQRYLPMSVFLFLGGAFFCFFGVIPYVLDFLFGFNTWLGLRPELKIASWISFALTTSLMFGVSFQLPLVMLFLERISIFTAQDYREKRRISILVIAIISMILTPSDPMSMMLMMVPLCILYELGILLCGKGQKASPFEMQAV